MIHILRTVTIVEEVRHEFGPPPSKPLRRGAIAAVLRNPYAGRYVDDIVPFMNALTPVGIDMAKSLLNALDVAANRIESYGKGAIVGAAGELEHGAVWHVPGGYAMRALLGWKEAQSSDVDRGAQPGNALAIVPSAKKVGAPGTALDVPMTHINASYVRSHFDAIEVRVPSAPAADEIVFVLAMSTGARIHARVGGLAARDIKLWDGLR